MDYFYSPSVNRNKDETVEIEGQEAQHILKVLRYTEGETIFVADGEGLICKCTIQQVHKKSLTVKIESQQEEAPPKIKKILALGVIRVRERFEFAIEKAVELGADELCVFDADRTQRAAINEKRLSLLIISAFKQSGRFWLPKLTVLNSLEEVLEHYAGKSLIMAHEKESLNSRVGALKQDSVLLVGPEGGFTEREVRLLEEKGGRTVSLGKNRLRAETAVAALLAQFLFEKE